MRRGVVAALLLLAVVTANGRASFVSYADVQPILRALADLLPPELKAPDPAQADTGWNRWIAGHDAAIRQRLTQGDIDTLVNWMLFGTTFTKEPRFPLAAGTVIGSDLTPLVVSRAHDLVLALANPGADERRVFARSLLARVGFVRDSPDERTRVEQYLLKEVARVFAESRQYAREIDHARQLGDASEDLAARSKLFRQRGLSLDTSLQPSFALEQTLRELKTKGILTAGAVRRVGVIGPGLDFSDKNSGYDFYPQQTLQPFAIIDAVRRLGLGGPAGTANDVRVVTFDISPRVNDHLSRARRLAASSGGAYTLHLLLDSTMAWKPDFLAYWRQAGGTIGAGIPDAAPAVFGTQVRTRGVRVRNDVVLRVTPEDLNVVTQRFSGAPLDLVIATNVFVYYDTLDQSLAASNIEAMLRPGGLLLSNNAILELPDSRLRSVGYTTVVYSDRTDDGDHVIWYRRLEPRAFGPGVLR